MKPNGFIGRAIATAAIVVWFFVTVDLVFYASKAKELNDAISGLLFGMHLAVSACALYIVWNENNEIN